MDDEKFQDQHKELRRMIKKQKGQVHLFQNLNLEVHHKQNDTLDIVKLI